MWEKKMLSSHKFQFISALLLLCLLVTVIAQPVQAGRSAQTVPTAGPSPTRQASSTPQDNNAEVTPPAPTAILATSQTGGIQPTLTATRTSTQPPATKKPASSATSPATATLSATDTPQSLANNQPVSTKVPEVSQASLPTLQPAAAAKDTSLAGAWCYPIGALILVVVIITVLKRIGTPGQKS
jgi:hypothetical protein